jgi:hypothetical protein
MIFDEDDVSDLFEGAFSGLSWQALLVILALILVGTGIYYSITHNTHPTQSTVRVEGIHVRQ